jgi:hypothetical protein
MIPGMPKSRSRQHIETLEHRRLMAAGVWDVVEQQPVGALTGRVVFTAAGHGYTSEADGTWNTQRGETNEIVEDMGNVDQNVLYADAALRAGATVVSLRPVGFQSSEAIVDDQQATFTGSWGAGASTPYFSTSNGAGQKYLFANSSPTETAVASFEPTLPTTGYYPVYTWALTGSNRLPDQVYRVVHSGGATEVKVNHRIVGRGWVYLGTYHFRAGNSARVEVSNRSSTTGVAIADAIRFGNGVGSIARVAGRTSGQTREDEAGLYWIEQQAGWTAANTRVASSNWRTSSNDGTATVGAPTRWAAYMFEGTFGQAVYLGWHSNAGGGRGTLGLWNNPADFPGTNTTNQRRWAELVALEMQNDMVGIGAPPLEAAWNNRGTNILFANSEFPYGEINGSINSEMDLTIIETAFHDSATDAQLMRDPKVRLWLARSATIATVRYFNQFFGGSLNFAPDAPTNVRSVTDNAGNVTLNWDAASSNNFTGGAATSWRVQGSRDGLNFDGGTIITGATNRTLVVPASLVGQNVAYFRVVAQNAGGESPPSPVVAAMRGVNRGPRVLIVNGYDRFDRTLNPTQTTRLFSTFNGSTGGTLVTIDRVRPRLTNSFDYVSQHASAIAAYASRVRIDSAANEAVINGQINLSNYSAVFWNLGRESSSDRTFDSTEQTIVSNYLNAGGKLMASGSEIAWDLDNLNNGRTFLRSNLRTQYAGDNANTYTASGSSTSIFNGITLTFDNGSSVYNVSSADQLTPVNGSVAALNYTGGNGGVAATVAQSGNSRTVVMGIPFETIRNANTRNTMMTRVLNFFGLNSIALQPRPKTIPVFIPNDTLQPLTGLRSSTTILRDENPANSAITSPLGTALRRVDEEGLAVGI